jgi:hypothetical protein
MDGIAASFSESAAHSRAAQSDFWDSLGGDGRIVLAHCWTRRVPLAKRFETGEAA